ncbi:galactosylgalactosylxylosylprotein 3-beta-glucuronosyltransferase 3-like [Symsagittifera roscoffensis]|uniref:galactosylgalactosylxylosylprotein 3-beta-glucuronosyltransferase 3-like n=1 Tax=Symsagittifera roscoffensis TaxID=84072 RepID=UPI00307BD437
MNIADKSKKKNFPVMVLCAALLVIMFCYQSVFLVLAFKKECPNSEGEKVSAIFSTSTHQESPLIFAEDPISKETSSKHILSSGSTTSYQKVSKSERTRKNEDNRWKISEATVSKTSTSDQKILSQSANDRQNSNIREVPKRLIVITPPTYNRDTQIPDLLRLKQTLQLVPNCDWIVVEDAAEVNPQVYSYLKDYNSGGQYYVAVKSDSRYLLLKGRSQRNKAIRILRGLYEAHNGTHQSNPYRDSVVYFADDDNTYDSQFLELLKETKKISLFNVDFLSNGSYGGPIVENEKIVGFQISWYGGRKFPVDMAGFAINVDFMSSKNFPTFPISWKGYMESFYLASFGLPASQMQFFKGEEGVHVWHTKTKKPEQIRKAPKFKVFLNGTVRTQ